MGFTLWYLVSDLHTITTTMKVPVYFYNTENIVVEAPETISITLRGKKSDIRHTNLSELAAHIDAQKLTQKTNHIPLTSQELFLPQTIKLVSYNPHHLIVNVKPALESV